MAEASKSRLTLDLEEIERQLTQSSQPQGSAKSDPLSRGDPLAELARIVGQDDPFRTLLQGGPAESAPREAAYDDPQYWGAAAPYGDPAVALTPEEEAILHGGPAPAYDQGRPEPDPYDPDALDYPEAGAPYVPVEPRRSRKGLLIAGGVLGTMALGAAGALFLQPSSLTGGPGGEPPIVKADTGPSKVVPQNPGGVDIPNQNKQIYERDAQDGQTRVVNREEQPIDVRQATRAEASVRISPNVPASGGGLQAMPGAAAGVLGEPRRVRTVSIRPDGSVIAPQQAGAAAANAVAPPALAKPAAPVPSASTPATTPTSPAQTKAPPPRPREATTTPAMPRATPAPASDPQAGAPLEITSDAQRSRVAAAPRPILREPTETSAAPEMGPGFSVQLGVRNTEREGRAMFDQLQQRYAGDLSGFQPLLRQAEINGKTAYRVRVGPMSRDDAVSLCSRLKASGGQCFVANN